jgi:hypothetical protein
MSIREWLNQRPRIAIGILAAVLVAVGAFAVSQLRDKHGPIGSDQVFFSDDDGQSYFRDSAANLPPFDHNGKTAVGAVVLRCPGGTPFVAYLQRYDAQAIALIRDFMKHARTPNPVPADMLAPPPMEVKKPGEPNWVSNSDPGRYSQVTTPKCPDGGSGPFATVSPEDPNDGAIN